MRWLALLLLLAGPVAAQEEVIADLSQDRISITTDFDGSEILIFGAVKRDAQTEVEEPLGIIITIAGPDAPVMVRRKSRVAGIWVNTTSVEVDAAPSFYAVATNLPLDDILLEIEDLRHDITTRRAIRAVGVPDDVSDSANYTQALIRIRERADLYQLLEGEVSLIEDTLFSSSISLPSNLVEGDYTVRIFLTRDQRVVASYETVIFVQKVGLERFLYTLAHERPLVYGIMALVIAAAAGWGASAGFRYLRS